MSKCVLVAQFSHETNTFSVQPADVAAFAQRSWHFGSQVPSQFRDTNTEMAGFLDCADAHEWSLLHTVSAAAGPCGRVTDEVWRLAVDAILEPLHSGAKIDGIALALHGAMVTESHDDAESQLLTLIRNAAGRDVPIAVTFDLHANLGAKTATQADIICSYKTYPHIDMRECARRAGSLLHEAMSGAMAPTNSYATRPMIQGADGGRTDVQPMQNLLDKAARFESEPGCLYVSINAGFPHADVSVVGPSVTITSDGTGERFQQMAEELLDDIWETRHVVNNTYLSVEDAVSKARAEAVAARPVVIADFADNPGAGSYGDATNLLRAMLDAGVENSCFGALCDGQAVAELCARGVGAEIEIDIGGKVHPAMGGGPLSVSGKILHITDGIFTYDGPMYAGMQASLGPSVVLRVSGVEILLTTHSQQILDVQQFRANGIEPTTKHIIGLKSMQHFRAAYEPIVAQVLVCDSGALASPDLTRLVYRNLRRPIYPLDEF